MSENDPFKNLDKLVAEAKITGIKNSTKVAATKRADPSKKQSSSIDAEDIHNAPKTLPKLRTLGTDSQEVLNQDNPNPTLLRVSADKQKRMSHTKKGNGVLNIILFILLVGGISSAYYLYRTQSQQTITIPTDSSIETTEEIKHAHIVPFDETISTPNLFENVDSHITLDSGVTIMADSTLTLETLLQNHLKHIPSLLTRNLDEEFTLGVFSETGIHSPFIILRSSYSFSLPGMQQWEEHLFIDLASLFETGVIERNIFLDVPHTFNGNIMRSDGSVVYGVTSDGYIVLSSDVSAIEHIFTELSLTEN